MIFTLDIGNTNITIAVMNDGHADLVFSLSTVRNRTADEYAALLQLVTRQYNIDPRTAEGAAIASVVPQLTPILREAVRIATGKKPLVIGPGVKTGLNIRIDNPSELGTDFVAAAVAAIATYPLPCVTIDMGTATTLGVLDKSGTYLGCVICPGVMLSQEILASRTSQLPNISPEAPVQVIGKNTEDCMRSGIMYGAAAQIDGLLTKIEGELGSPVTVVATGEITEVVIPLCKRKDIKIDRELVMRGLWLIYQKNKKSSKN